jgi:hypothetical protein
VFKHYSVLAMVGMLINGMSIVVSVYVLYLQSSLNYLFFSCIEVAIVAVLMMTLIYSFYINLLNLAFHSVCMVFLSFVYFFIEF